MSAANRSWVGLEPAVLRAVHEEQLAEHGGGTGVRNAGLFESAMNRPRQAAHYGAPDVADLASSYGFGLARNHPFVDGNKRTAFVAVELFLALNGYTLDADDADCVMTMLAVASGTLDETAFAAWVRSHIRT
ncbi:type II toxin-antitoxin system death-on-curing family toxin [uncultured Xylophilus sp.]|uniref:type II toxin-antitoxin system death-on-curing family toxin n=1 Tax=uncultured Xylophilus sp. TaxID=296832 RepID=UPI0025D12A73|nr:type II toxin-antitoxin system death-on-curing family toxin [uncultured Xylophilus sp.]